MAHLALALPEVLQLICKLLAKSDLTRLLTVSRHFYACAVPLLWDTLYSTYAVQGLLTTVGWVYGSRVNDFDSDGNHCASSTN